MTAHSASHARYEELVVGYALAALEPEDEHALLRHLPTCAACERELAVHQETLAHLAAVTDEEAPPPGLWEGIRRQVVAESGPEAFSPAPPAASGAPRDVPGPAPVADLGAVRAARRLGPGARRGAWAAVAAGVVLVAGVSVGATSLVEHRDSSGAVSGRLAAAVRSVESGPGETVPLAPRDGKAVAVAVVQSGRVSLIVDGLEPNDRSSSVYVLWGQSGAEPTQALGTFDADGSVDVIRDLVVMPAGTAMPQLFVITREAGRTAPPVAHGPALATGRTA